MQSQQNYYMKNMYITICRQGSTWSCSSIVDKQYIRSIIGPKTQMNYVLTAYSSCDKDSKFTLLHFMTDNYQSHLSASICALHLKFISSNERRVIHSLGYCCSVMITDELHVWSMNRQKAGAGMQLLCDFATYPSLKGFSYRCQWNWSTNWIWLWETWCLRCLAFWWITGIKCASPTSSVVWASIYTLSQICM